MTRRIRQALALARRARGEAGFTLIEVIVAMALTLVLMTAVLSVLVSSLRSVKLAHQRQTATSLTTQAMEQLRALDYSSVTTDLHTTGPYPMSPGLQYVTGTTFPVFQPTAVLPGISEPLIVNQYSAKIMDPSTTTVDGLTYRVQVYVTDPAPTAGQSQAYNLTVITSWSSAVSEGARVVSQRSTLFSPSGCLTAADHPFSGPCQAAYVADAGQSLGGFTLSADGGTGEITGFNGQMLSLSLPVLSSNLTMEQSANAKGMVGTGEGRATSGSQDVTGGVGASVAVTSDPSAATAQTQTSNAMQSAGEVSLSGSLGSLVAHAPGGTGGTTSAAIFADPGLCQDGTQLGTGLTTGPAGARRPCVASSVSAVASDGYLSLRTGLQDAMLLSQGSAGSGFARAVSANLAGPSGTACAASTPTILTGSCVRAAVTRTLGTVTVLPLASAVGAPAGYRGLWYVDGLQETATSESGRYGAGPTYYRQGSLHVWNPSTASYDPAVDLSTFSGSGAPTPITLPSMTLTYPDGLTVTASGTLTVNHTTTTTTSSSGCTTTCTAGVDGSSAVRALVTFTATRGADTSTFGLAADLGGLLASTSYKAAPGA
ncbi:MAG TPA: prepilin-type N-terminal cleavage/methylation domain-containing protein [Propionicimonas sp.]